MAAHNIFAAQLAQLRHGYALWCPEPWAYDEVRVGDVGYLRRGVFYRLFNATLAANDPANARFGVPDGFVPLALPPNSTYRNEKYFDPGPLHSGSVSKFQYGVSAKNSGISGPGIQFSCSDSVGAALLLTRRAIREDTLLQADFEQYMLQNYRSWYKFANDLHRRGLSSGEITLVTGCDKTAEWASAVFTEQGRDAKFSLSEATPKIASGEVTLSGTWERGTSVQHRSGPVCGSSITFNQTIFIRGYRLRERATPSRQLTPCAFDGALNYHEQDSLLPIYRPEERLSPTPTPNDAITPVHGNPIDFHPADAILEYILKYSDDPVAIVHDDDWCHSYASRSLPRVSPSEPPFIDRILELYEQKFFRGAESPRLEPPFDLPSDRPSHSRPDSGEFEVMDYTVDTIGSLVARQTELLRSYSTPRRNVEHNVRPPGHLHPKAGAASSIIARLPTPTLEAPPAYMRETVPPSYHGRSGSSGSSSNQHSQSHDTSVRSESSMSIRSLSSSRSLHPTPSSASSHRVETNSHNIVNPADERQLASALFARQNELLRTHLSPADATNIPRPPKTNPYKAKRREKPSVNMPELVQLSYPQNSEGRRSPQPYRLQTPDNARNQGGGANQGEQRPLRNPRPPRIMGHVEQPRPPVLRIEPVTTVRTPEVKKPAIVVMGAMGSGKTTFINLITPLDSKSLLHRKDSVQASLPFALDGRYVTLIDTPGIDGKTRSDKDVTKLVSAFMSEASKDGLTLIGVIFLRRITDFKTPGISVQNMQMLRELCGTAVTSSSPNSKSSSSLRNVVVATNRWEEVSREVGEAREADLKARVFGPVLDEQAQLARHHNTVESGQAILRLIMKNQSVFV